MSEWDPVSLAIIKGLSPAIEALQGLGYIGEATLFVRTPGIVCRFLPDFKYLILKLI